MSAPAKYVTKAVPVDALQYRPDLCNCEAVAKFVGNGAEFDPDECDDLGDDHASTVWHLDSFDYCMDAHPGDWIVRGALGDLRVLSPDAFAATYEQKRNGLALHLRDAANSWARCGQGHFGRRVEYAESLAAVTCKSCRALAAVSGEEG
jgi:hypothetical protein